MSTAAAAAAQKRQLMKGELPLILSSSDDHAVLKQVLATHAPDGREINATPLLLIVEDVLKRAKATASPTPQTHLDLRDDKAHNRSGVAGLLEALAYTINKISRAIEFKCSEGGSGVHDRAVQVLKSLSSYSWDAKVVLTLAAFAASYGEFWLVAQLHSLDPLAKSLAVLKQIPDVLEHRDVLAPRFEALNRLTRAMLDVAKRIVEFKDLPLESSETSMATAHIPTAVYWMVRSAVVCSSQINGLIGLGHGYISSTTEEAWEISSLAHKVGNIHGHLTKQLELCHQHIVDKRSMEAYNGLVRVFETDHVDNTKILRELVSSQDDLPLVDGLSRIRVSLDVLRRKVVLLLVSDLDISHEDELQVLVQIYSDDVNRPRPERQYEILWLPLVDRHDTCTPAKEEIFDRIAANMPWYSLRHPSLLAPAAVKYARDVWRFDKKPVLVVLDAEGKVVCMNAMNMMWIWGSLAFPFTSKKEEELWKEETWRLELLVDSIDPAILEWVKEGRHVCLYGGEDIDWIKRFTALLRRVSKETGVPVETVYVGKSNSNERSRKVTAAIASEGLSGYWSDRVMLWFFWTRLESMWHSKMQHGMTAASDPVMRQVTAMLGYDGSDEGWAAIGRAGDIVVANGKRLVNCLMQFDVWKEDVAQRGMVPALRNALVPFETPGHCAQLVLPEEAEKINEQAVCAECGRWMEKLVLYRCCSD